MAHSYPKSASVSYNASYKDAAVDDLAAQYGDFLEKISTIDKVGLLAILALWQHADSIEDDGQTLDDAARITYPYSLPQCCGNLDEIIDQIEDLTDEAAFSLMVAIANQLVAEQRE